MSAYTPSGSGAPGSGAPGSGAGGVGRRIEEAIELIEMELRHTIAYVNDAVVPQVRRESVSAMRTVADTLRNLADRIDRNDRTQGGTTGQSTDSSRGPRSG
jgi:hypothetical protein